MKFKLLHGDCLIKMKNLDDNSVDAVVTDPPYGLSFMGKKWDYNVPSTEIWQEALRVLKPGGHLLSFAGSRTYHRLAVNVEDAGFEIRDQIMWVYGSGFPKSHNISKAIDKAAGAERKVIGQRNPFIDGGKRRTSTKKSGVDFVTEKHLKNGLVDVTAPATPEAQQWDGWGSALKPAHEPIVVARKPLIGTIVENVLEHGTGGLNIDGCRVGDIVQDTSKNGRKAESQKATIFESGLKKDFDGKITVGRFPANFIHDGSEEVVSLLKRGFNEDGSAARFFYCAKANKTERGEGNIHPTVKPIDLMRYLCRLVTPPNGVILDPFMGSGTTGIAATAEGFNFIGIEMNDEYIKIANHRISNWVEEKQELIIEQRKQKTLFGEW